MRVPLIALLVAMAGADASAQSPDLIDADRPGLADTGRTVGAGTVQFEVGLQWEQRGSQDSEFVPALFRIGLGDRLEARIEGNTVTTAVIDGIRQTGLATTSFGLAFAVVPDAEGHRPSVGIIARALPPWASSAFETQSVTGDVRLAAEWDVSEHVSINPNIGLGWYEGESGSFVTGLFALTASYAPRPQVSWFIDSGVKFPEAEEGTTAVVFDGGVAYIPRENWQIDISAGTRAHGETPPRPFVAIGFAYRHK